MGFIWEVLKDLTKTAVNVSTLGALDVKVIEDEHQPVKRKPPAPVHADSVQPASVPRKTERWVGGILNTLHTYDPWGNVFPMDTNLRGNSLLGLELTAKLVADGLAAKASPVAVPEDLVQQIVRKPASANGLEGYPRESWRGWSAIIANVEGALHVHVANPSDILAFSSAYSYKQNAKAWNTLMEEFKSDIRQRVEEPPAPWHVFIPHSGEKEYPPCPWMFDLQYAVGTVFLTMIQHSR